MGSLQGHQILVIASEARQPTIYSHITKKMIY